MTYVTISVAALTGGTAVLASWVTSRGNARAAKIQAELPVLAERNSRKREVRRAAYLDFMEQAHITGELHFRLGDIYAQVADPQEQSARIEKLRADLRDAFDPLMRAGRVIVLEGPAPVVQAAHAVEQAAADANSALWRIAQGDSGARDRFYAANRLFRSELEEFIQSASGALEDS